MRARRLFPPAVLVLVAAAAPLRAQDRSLVVGAERADSLTSHDPLTRSRNAPYQTWTFEGHRGQRVVIDMMSSDFDSYLVLRDPDGVSVANDDDSGEGNNARIRTVLPRDGTYRVVTTAYNSEGRGRYSVLVSSWQTPDAPPPGAVVGMRTGDSRTGVLEPGDSISGDGPYEDHWTFDAAVGARLRVELRSQDFDAYLIIVGPNDSVIGKDDDGLGDRNSVVSFRAPAAGRYTAIASSYGDNPSTGTYQIDLIDDSGNYADAGMVATIGVGETKDGRLEAGDDSGPRGLQDRWTFTGRAGQVAQIDAISTQFDTYLQLVHDGMLIDSNDDGGGGTNSRIVTVLPATGAYTVLVSAYSEGHSGRYTLGLTLAAPPAGPAQVARAVPGQHYSGRLEPGDRPRGDGAYEDWFDLDGHAGQVVAIEMHSSAFDAYLELRDANDQIVAENDDGFGEGTDAMIVTQLPATAHYRIVARSYGDEAHTGLYDLGVSLAAAAAPPGHPMEIHAGDLVVGRLEAGDSILGDSTYADIYTFRADRGGNVVIDLHADDFDAFLLFQDQTGRTLVTDDDSGSGTDARITTHVTAGQTYRILANSYGAERNTGAYRISVHWSP